MHAQLHMWFLYMTSYLMFTGINVYACLLICQLAKIEFLALVFCFTRLYTVIIIF